jgi:hypothetical protein
MILWLVAAGFVHQVISIDAASNLRRMRGSFLTKQQEIVMRMILDITIPHEPFNSLVRKGVVGKKLGKILEALKPEAIYFGEHDGKRGAVAIVDVADPSKIPAIAEPWFLTFNADVKFRVMMTPDDLKKSGLDAIGKKWG